MKPQIREYIFGRMQRVPGWLGIVDAVVIDMITSAQERMGVTGAMAEIGLHFGRSFYLLGLLKRPQEGLYGADLFLSKAPKFAPDQMTSLIEYGRALGVEVRPDHLFVGDSANLEPARILEAVGPVRLFSIDGGHYQHHLKVDSATADAVLSERGVIAFDDYANSLWPEVTIGMMDFLRENADRYAIFCVTRGKLYACHRQHYQTYVEAVMNGPHIKHSCRQRIRLLWDEPIHYAAGRRAEWPAEILSRLGLGWGARFLY